MNVVIVTPWYEEMRTPAGLYAASLAASLSQRGHRVDVIARQAPAARPRHETHGPLTLHRLNVRRHSPPPAFAVAAARRLHELAEATDRLAVECIDAPWCWLGAAALRRSPGFEKLQLGWVTVDPDADPELIARLADRRTIPPRRVVAGATVPVTPLDRSFLNLQSAGLGDLPPRCLVGCDATSPARRSLLTAGFKASSAYAAGWSLALPGIDGRWAILPGKGGTTSASDDEPRAPVTVTLGRGLPILAATALASGCPATLSPRNVWSPLLRVIDESLILDPADSASLGRSLDALVCLNPIERSSVARRCLTALEPAFDPEAVVKEFERTWTRPRRSRPVPDRWRAWSRLQRRWEAEGLRFE